MSVTLDPKRFRQGHKLFRNFVEAEEGVPFTGWEHPYLLDSEVSYKQAAWRDAHDRLEVRDRTKWNRMLERNPEEILQRIRDVSVKAVSRNLVLSRPHFDKAIKAPELAMEMGKEATHNLARHLHAWFQNPDDEPFPVRFDRLVDHLSETKGLPCHGAWLAYLAFLQDRTRYFPIRTGYFENLAHFYGNPDLRVTNKLTWKRYSNVLQLADLLTERLSILPCGSPDAIEVQSYMWVIAKRLKEEGPSPDDPGPLTPDDPDERLQQRLNAAVSREHHGWQGEMLVLQAERAKLREAERPDLAEDVLHVADDESVTGYDVRSYTPKGDLRKIEVKATTARATARPSFTLTEGERRIAQNHSEWRLHYVTNIEGSPEIENLGNVVRDQQDEGWQLAPQAWRCSTAH